MRFLKVVSVIGLFVAVMGAMGPVAMATNGGAVISSKECLAMGWRPNANGTCAPLDGACFALEKSTSSLPPDSATAVDLYWPSGYTYDTTLGRYVGTSNSYYFLYGTYEKKTVMRNFGCHVVNLSQRTIDIWLAGAGQAVRSHYGAVWDGSIKSFCEGIEVTKSFYDTNATLKLGAFTKCSSNVTTGFSGFGSGAPTVTLTGNTTGGTSTTAAVPKAPLGFKLPAANSLQAPIAR